MIPLPRDTPGEWSGKGGGESHNHPEAGIAFGQPCAIDRWPNVPIRMLAGRDDRFFLLDFPRRVARLLSRRQQVTLLGRPRFPETRARCAPIRLVEPGP